MGTEGHGHGRGGPRDQYITSMMYYYNHVPGIRVVVPTLLHLSHLASN